MKVGLFQFLGPLAQRSEQGTHKSIGLFFLYYVLANFAASLATKQVVDPATAAWLPNIGMATLALWFFARLR